MKAKCYLNKQILFWKEKRDNTDTYSRPERSRNTNLTRQTLLKKQTVLTVNTDPRLTMTIKIILWLATLALED